ncbi:hypothetical protein L195_g062414, partial [Trifolium pratense]
MELLLKTRDTQGVAVRFKSIARRFRSALSVESARGVAVRFKANMQRLGKIAGR